MISQANSWPNICISFTARLTPHGIVAPGGFFSGAVRNYRTGAIKEKKCRQK